MSNVEPYVGELRMFAGNFAPVGWMLCQGQLIPISEYEVLFNLIGTTYGGDGQSTFRLPDLQGRFPMHQGAGHIIGETGGTETVTLTTQTMAAHSHSYAASTADGTGNNPGNMASARSPSFFEYYEDAPSPTAAFANNSITPVGGGKAHDNIQPFVVINFIISLYGVYPYQG